MILALSPARASENHLGLMGQEEEELLSAEIEKEIVTSDSPLYHQHEGHRDVREGHLS